MTASLFADVFRDVGKVLAMYSSNARDRIFES
jgi:hypothetical protein